MNTLERLGLCLDGAQGAAWGRRCNSISARAAESRGTLRLPNTGFKFSWLVLNRNFIFTGALFGHWWAAGCLNYFKILCVGCQRTSKIFTSAAFRAVEFNMTEHLFWVLKISLRGKNAGWEMRKAWLLSLNISLHACLIYKYFIFLLWTCERTTKSTAESQSATQVSALRPSAGRVGTVSSGVWGKCVWFHPVLGLSKKRLSSTNWKIKVDTF